LNPRARLARDLIELEDDPVLDGLVRRPTGLDLDVPADLVEVVAGLGEPLRDALRLAVRFLSLVLMWR